MVSKIEGTGLGMAITKNIVDMMGGTITVTSELGVGSEFIVKLRFRTIDWHNIEKEAKEAGVTAFCAKPLIRSELLKALKSIEDGATPKIVANDPKEQFKGKRVLIVDDVDLNREIAMAVIEDAGMKAETAENGQVEADMVVRSKDGYYDLILMDVMMPIMDGYQATQEIRRLENRKLADIPIIAMTANAFEEDRQAAIKAGMDDHLAKPIQIEKLYEMMKKYL